MGGGGVARKGGVKLVSCDAELHLLLLLFLLVTAAVATALRYATADACMNGCMAAALSGVPLVGVRMGVWCGASGVWWCVSGFQEGERMGPRDSSTPNQCPPTPNPTLT